MTNESNQTDRVVRAQELRRTGEAARRREPATARKCYEEAAQLLRGVAEPLVVAHVVRHLGDVYMEQDCPELAEACYHEALKLYRGQGDHSSLDLANAIRSLAVLRWEQSLALWKEALGLYTSLNIEPGIKETTARIAALSMPRPAA
jgi:tetratricopeptide (TPR) repeat protein